jgi:branched-subunit amino acid ABC-type transport system permease component
MNFWLSEVLVDGGLTAALAVGLGLHLRLVRFFDLGWAIWAMSAALVAVDVALWSGSFWAGVLAGGLVGALMGLGEDYFLLSRQMGSLVYGQTLERFHFTAALAAYLAATSVTDVLGFRDYEMIPATEGSWVGLPVRRLMAAGVCWGALAICAGIRYSRRGMFCRALLDDSSACLVFGFRVPAIAGVLGLVAGGLTGIASGCFGLLYVAHQTTGFTVMLRAVIPFILVGARSSGRIVVVSLLVVVVIAGFRTQFGETASHYLVYGVITLLLALRPEGLSREGLRRA